MISPTFAAAFDNEEELTTLIDMAPIVPSLPFPDVDEADAAVSLLRAVVDVAVSIASQMDLYTVQPTSVPWICSALGSLTEDADRAILSAAKREWRAVTTFEKHQPGQLKSHCHIVTTTWYRELMAAGNLGAHGSEVVLKGTGARRNRHSK